MVWHASWCARPLIVTRHSWHMPIPQTGARGMPLTEIRAMALPAIAIAAATVVPASTTTVLWSINKEMDSGIFPGKKVSGVSGDQLRIGHQLWKTRRQIWLYVDGSGMKIDLCREQFGGGQ